MTGAREEDVARLCSKAVGRLPQSATLRIVQLELSLAGGFGGFGGSPRGVFEEALAGLVGAGGAFDGAGYVAVWLRWLDLCIANPAMAGKPGAWGEAGGGEKGRDGGGSTAVSSSSAASASGGGAKKKLKKGAGAGGAQRSERSERARESAKATDRRLLLTQSWFERAVVDVVRVSRHVGSESRGETGGEGGPWEERVDRFKAALEGLLARFGDWSMVMRGRDGIRDACAFVRLSAGVPMHCAPWPPPAMLTSWIDIELRCPAGEVDAASVRAAFEATLAVTDIDIDLWLRFATFEKEMVKSGEGGPSRIQQVYVDTGTSVVCV